MKIKFNFIKKKKIGLDFNINNLNNLLFLIRIYKKYLCNVKCKLYIYILLLFNLTKKIYILAFRMMIIHIVICFTI